MRQRAAWSLSNVISSLCEYDAEVAEAPAVALQCLAASTCATVRKCLNDNDKVFVSHFLVISHLNVNFCITLFLLPQVRSSGIRCAGMLGHLARKSNPCSGPVWESAWSDIQPSVCTCLLSFLEVADFAPKVKWNTCSAVQRLLQWKTWDEHTMCVNHQL